MAVRWTEKYRPASLREVLGNNKAVTDLREWAEAWERGKPISRAAILYGPAGIGKTSAALALASEMQWDWIEMNASDIRTASMIERIAGPASKSRTFSGQRRLVVLDEADNLHGTADRGGAAAMLKLVRGASQPVLLIANEYYEIDKALRDAAKGIQFRSVRSPTIASALREICRAEGVACDPEALQLIAERAGGDLRSAINDLQAAAEGLTELNLSDVVTAERDVRSSIFRVLDTIFKGKGAKEALVASYSLDESPEDLIQWVDENLPLAYRGQDLFWGFERLARADVFLGRVRRRQTYGLWRYAGFLMTAGVQASRSSDRHGYIAFRPPSRWRRLGQTRKARNVRDSAAKKIGRHCHVSARFSRAELMGFVGLLLKNKKLAPMVAAELDLNADEIALLMESNPATKKVQTIFEEAQKIRDKERVEDIELAWHGAAPADRKVQAEGQEASEPEKELPPRRRGRPPKAGGAKAEQNPGPDVRTPEKSEVSKSETSKKQRSLFDF